MKGNQRQTTISPGMEGVYGGVRRAKAMNFMRIPCFKFKCLTNICRQKGGRPSFGGTRRPFKKEEEGKNEKQRTSQRGLGSPNFDFWRRETKHELGRGAASRDTIFAQGSVFNPCLDRLVAAACNVQWRAIQATSRRRPLKLSYDGT